jgi:hypothetical protein
MQTLGFAPRSAVSAMSACNKQIWYNALTDFNVMNIAANSSHNPRGLVTENVGQHGHISKTVLNMNICPTDAACVSFN